MKVYAHYYKAPESEGGYDYRWRTLLQFGASWNIVGSVVMKNPDSAAPTHGEDLIVSICINGKRCHGPSGRGAGYDRGSGLPLHSHQAGQILTPYKSSSQTKEKEQPK